MSGDGRTAQVVLPTAADCRRLGEVLASVLRPGDLVVLTGALGAGKTVLAQGIGSGLGVTDPVTSPTFVIARVHTGGSVPLVHVDAYRLGGLAEVDDLDLDSDLADSVLVVEWGEGLVERLTQGRLEVRIDRRRGGTGEDGPRSATLVAVGDSWTARLRGLRLDG